MGIQGIDNLFGDDFPEHKSHDATDVPLAAAKGCVVIDNTSHFRMDPDVPLVIDTHTGDGPGFVTTEAELPPGDFEEDKDDSRTDSV